MTTEKTGDRIREVAAGRPPKPKRFYKIVAVTSGDDGFAVALDGRIAKTPKRKPLVVPTELLAKALVKEWDDQTSEIDAEDMPLTQLANTAIDGVADTFDVVLDTLADYARADLLCYRVAYPEALAQKQDDAWQPVLDWLHGSLGARMEVTTGIMSVDQPEESISAIRAAFARYCPWRLTAAHSLAGVYKSVALALAVMEGQLSAKEAHLASRLDEDFQNNIWGKDAEALRLSDRLAHEAIAAETFASLLITG